MDRSKVNSLTPDYISEDVLVDTKQSLKFDLKITGTSLMQPHCTCSPCAVPSMPVLMRFSWKFEHNCNLLGIFSFVFSLFCFCSRIRKKFQTPVMDGLDLEKFFLWVFVVTIFFKGLIYKFRARKKKREFQHVLWISSSLILLALGNYFIASVVPLIMYKMVQ